MTVNVYTGFCVKSQSTLGESGKIDQLVTLDTKSGEDKSYRV